MINNDSVWEESYMGNRKFRELDKNIDVDVCIVGGGITGISTAYYLSKEGMKVCVLEKDRIDSKTSSKTTGKVTSQHHLFYKYLIDSQGKDFAKKYLKANEEAISNIESIINEENIECDFEKKGSFVWTKNLGKLPMITDEVKAVNSLGLKAKYVDEIEVVGRIEGGIEFPNQAQFNPVKYVSGLANSVLKNDGEIFENTKVVDYEKDGDNFIVTSDVQGEKRKIKCKYLVVTTRYPIFNVPGFYFIKMYQELEYAIAIETDQKLNGMYVSVETPTISFRDCQINNQNYILVLGNGHKTGEKTKESGFGILEDFAKEHFPNCNVKYRWTAEDCIGLDKIPYIGEYSEIRKNMYVATGFKKWGMTTSNIAGKMITDMIFGRQNKYEEIFKATRVEPIKNKEEMKNMLEEAGKSIIGAGLKNEKGKKYCSHLGCELTWNEDTETWECPCHGSRFEREGQSIETPSIHNLE